MHLLVEDYVNKKCSRDYIKNFENIEDIPLVE
jgi:hypothetical protein